MGDLPAERTEEVCSVDPRYRLANESRALVRRASSRLMRKTLASAALIHVACNCLQIPDMRARSNAQSILVECDLSKSR